MHITLKVGSPTDKIYDRQYGPYEGLIDAGPRSCSMTLRGRFCACGRRPVAAAFWDHEGLRRPLLRTCPFRIVIPDRRPRMS